MLRHAKSLKVKVNDQAAESERALLYRRTGWWLNDFVSLLLGLCSNVDLRGERRCFYSRYY